MAALDLVEAIAPGGRKFSSASRISPDGMNSIIACTRENSGEVALEFRGRNFQQ